jgi:glycosyltransferase involved in cell wall biosynthesis
VRGLLGRFADRDEPAVTMLATAEGGASYSSYRRGSLGIRVVSRHAAGAGGARRGLGMVAGLFVGRSATEGLDLVHYPVTVPLPRTRLPTVVTVHDLQHQDLPEAFGTAERLWRRWAYDRAARTATRVITPSEHSRRRVVEQLGIDPSRATAIPLGIDHDRFRPDREPDDESILEELGCDREYVLYPANLWPHKNHARLLDGFARSRVNAQLVLTGQAYGGLPQLMARAAELGLAARVRHLGFVPSRAMPALMRGARGLVFPSLYEGFGSPPLEAMACGCPVASSDRGSLAEVCGDAALPLDPEGADSIAEAIVKLATEEDVRADLRERGLRHAAGFTWERAAAEHRRVYREAVLPKT